MMEKKQRRILIVGLTLVAVIILTALIFALWHSHTEEAEAIQIVENAEYYISVGQYDDAVIELNKAIEANKEEPEAYIMLAHLYYERKHDLKSAISTLERALLYCNSERISMLLQQYRGLLELGHAAEQTEKTGNSETVLNSSLLQILSSSTYADYRLVYGNSNSVSADNDGCCLRYSKLDALFYYENTDKDSAVINSATKEPFDVKRPNYIVLQDLSTLFGNTVAPIQAESIRAISGVTDYSTEYNAEYQCTILRFSYCDCIILLKIDEEGNIQTQDQWNRIIPNGVSFGTQRILEGNVIDATTGGGVANTKLDFYTRTGTLSFSVQSDSDGRYHVEIDSGDYRVTAGKNGYIEETFDVNISEYSNVSHYDFVISPELNEGEVRFVLEWESTPRDLDSYLQGHMDDGSEFLIYFNNRTYSANGKTIATLDVDDMDGYGPETTTCNNLNGVLTFYVRDYGRTNTMSHTRATVKVYMPNETEPREIVLNGEVGNAWLVCIVDHGELQIRNCAY